MTRAPLPGFLFHQSPVTNNRPPFLSFGRDYLSSVAAAPILSPSSMKSLELDVVVTRGAVVESRHRVHAAVVDESGALIGAARDASYVTAWRGLGEPVLVIPLFGSGGFCGPRWGGGPIPR